MKNNLIRNNFKCSHSRLKLCQTYRSSRLRRISTKIHTELLRSNYFGSISRNGPSNTTWPSPIFVHVGKIELSLNLDQLHEIHIAALIARIGGGFGANFDHISTRWTRTVLIELKWTLLCVQAWTIMSQSWLLEECNQSYGLFVCYWCLTIVEYE